jgi:hypothetical protein
MYRRFMAAPQALSQAPMSLLASTYWLSSEVKVERVSRASSSWRRRVVCFHVSTSAQRRTDRTTQLRKTDYDTISFTSVAYRGGRPVMTALQHVSNALYVKMNNRFQCLSFTCQLWKAELSI